ncbi:hypothetical protein DNTS_000309 [Danionella cerebrum]|uniref:Disks large homolog 1-4 PDZ-associated domain-containing protein n=1 Tax=Danionella cerebrum TaxID=2873325 RepID=A0A553R737_9TELE|nr:hypothetical protein DNTS_000309 [Danionella translucida]
MFCQEKQIGLKLFKSTVGYLVKSSALFPFTGLGLPPAFPTMVDNHVGHNSSMAYMGGMESKQVYQPPQVTPSRYSPVPRHMLGEEDFTRAEPIYSAIHKAHGDTSPPSPHLCSRGSGDVGCSPAPPALCQSLVPYTGRY